MTLIYFNKLVYIQFTTYQKCFLFQPARHSKLEKADILEMTVKHLQSIQRQQLAVAVATDPAVLHKFKSGFSECATEVNRYINNMDGVETGVKQRLVAHLSGCVTGLQQVAPTFSFPGMSTTGNTSTIPLTITQGSSNGVSIHTGPFNGDVNNNQNSSRIQVPAGIQLIPSRLPTGELALLVPNSSNLPFFSSTVIGGSGYQNTETNHQTPQRQTTNNSAFTSVRPMRCMDLKMKISPPLSPASSTTSFEDHQLSESFSRPRTPSPREVTISFPTPPGPSNHSSAFKPSNSHQEQSPPQHLQVTSTSVSPENAKIPLKIEYKTVPIYQHDNKMSYKPQKSLEPLSVITTDRFRQTGKENEVFYRKKRAYPVDEGLLTVYEHASTSKVPRCDDVSTTSSGSPDQRSEYKPSTSGSHENNDSMWRPW